MHEFRNALQRGVFAHALHGQYISAFLMPCLIHLAKAALHKTASQHARRRVASTRYNLSNDVEQLKVVQSYGFTFK